MMQEVVIWASVGSGDYAIFNYSLPLGVLQVGNNLIQLLDIEEMFDIWKITKIEWDCSENVLDVEISLNEEDKYQEEDIKLINEELQKFANKH